MDVPQPPSEGDCDDILVWHVREGKQRESLQAIFGGQGGGWPGEFAQGIGEVRGVEYAPIKFGIADDLAHWSVEVPGRRADAPGSRRAGRRRPASASRSVFPTRGPSRRSSRRGCSG